MQSNSLRRYLLASTIVFGLAGTGAAFARDKTAQDKSATVQEVVVTGSRIARPNLDAPTAIQTVDSRTLQSTGAINVAAVLRDLPASGVSGYTPTSTGFATAGNGISTVNLRNLGDSRTLVLVNGRRFVPGVVGSQVVDFNTIPTAIIDRVDVVTGGASAVYGSDAIGGVINIITKKKFDGISISGQAGISDRNDSRNYSLSITAGTQFADGKGSAIVSVTRDYLGTIYARNRGDRGMAKDALNGYDGSDPKSYRTQIAGGFSTYSEKGYIDVPYIDPVTGKSKNSAYVIQSDGSLQSFSTPRDGFNRQGSRLLQIPSDRLAVSSYLNYDHNQYFKLFGEINYTKTELSSQIEPTPLGSTDVYGAGAYCTVTGGVQSCTNGVSLASAIVPTALRNQVLSLNPGMTADQLVVGFRRRMTETGYRSNDITRDTFRVVGGFTGDLNEDHHYEFSVNYGRTTDYQTSGGALLKANLMSALDVIVDGSGKLVCRDATARANGCAPVNVFGQGKISPEGAKYISAMASRNGVIEETVVNGFFSGKLFEVPAGRVSYVAGLEYRREYSSDTPDALTQRGMTTGNQAPITSGGFTVKEAFGELRVPLLRDLTFVKSLDLNLAYRSSDYSTAGHADAYAASLEYKPVDFLKLRGQYSHAVRAPNVSELFQPAAQTFPSVNDVCQGVTLSGGKAAFFNTRKNLLDPSKVLGSGIDASTVGSAVANACMSDPTIAARVARDGGFAYSQAEAQGVSGFDSGNTKLKPEEADSYTAGILFNPTWNKYWSGLSVSLDYYNIKITKQISSVARDVLVANCYAAGFNPNSPFCSAVVRNNTGPLLGGLKYVNVSGLNLAETRTSGIDLAVTYRLRLADLPILSGYGKDLGRLTTNLNYSYLSELTTVPFDGASDTQISRNAGTMGSPRDHARFSLDYRLDKLNIVWTSNLIGKTVISKSVLSDYYNLKVPGAVFHDLYVNYEIKPGLEAYVGVNNVFDKYVFIGGTAAEVPGSTTGWTTAPDIYDGVGRRFFGGFRLKF